jgi:hypothetical protein
MGQRALMVCVETGAPSEWFASRRRPGPPALAVGHISRALDLKPGQAGFLLNRGVALRGLGRPGVG